MRFTFFIIGICLITAESKDPHQRSHAKQIEINTPSDQAIQADGIAVADAMQTAPILSEGSAKQQQIQVHSAQANHGATASATLRVVDARGDISEASQSSESQAAAAPVTTVRTETPTSERNSASHSKDIHSSAAAWFSAANDWVSSLNEPWRRQKRVPEAPKKIELPGASLNESIVKLHNSMETRSEGPKSRGSMEPTDAMLQALLHAAHEKAENYEGSAMKHFEESFAGKPPKQLEGDDLWITFFASICAFIGLDIFLMGHVARNMNGRFSIPEWIVHLAFWLIATVIFAAYIYEIQSEAACISFVNGFFMEILLSCDNVLVFSVIFQTWHTPVEARPRPLIWGMIGAVIMRLLLYTVFNGLMAVHGAISIILAAFLIYAGTRACIEDDAPDAEEDFRQYNIINWLGKILPTTPMYIGDKFLHEGKLTLLFYVTLCIEGTDIFFAFDSMAAKVAQIPDVYLAYTSTCFAMCVIRTFFFVIDEMVRAFAYMKYGLALTLWYIALKLVFPKYFALSELAFLTMIVSVFALCIVLTYVYPPDTGEDEKDSLDNRTKSQKELQEREREKYHPHDAARRASVQGLAAADGGDTSEDDNMTRKLLDHRCTVSATMTKVYIGGGRRASHLRQIECMMSAKDFPGVDEDKLYLDVKDPKASSSSDPPRTASGSPSRSSDQGEKKEKVQIHD